MTQFKKYQHVERLDSPETEGLLEGYCTVFYKIDGTNASIWLKEDGELGFGSRNRELSLENDNAGFMAWGVTQNNLKPFFAKYPSLRLYGEWLVPHSLKTYREDAWKRFYVFDVLEDESDTHVPYSSYKEWLDEFGIDYIPPLAEVKTPTPESLLRCLEKSGQFLVEDGKGGGEGIVIKNYEFQNKYGRTTWGKMISNQFKEVHHREMGAPEINNTLIVEERIVDEFLTDEFIGKEKAKILTEEGTEDWQNKYIPRLLGVVFYELVREHSWDMLKKHKNPTIRFKTLKNLSDRRVKKYLGL